jgi:hypothetical protein
MNGQEVGGSTGRPEVPLERGKPGPRLLDCDREHVRAQFRAGDGGQTVAGADFDFHPHVCFWK